MRKTLLMCAILALAGCATRTSGIIVDNGEIVVKDARVASKIEYKGQVLVRTELGFPQAQVTIHNKKRYDYRFQYKFTWFDANGLELPATTEVWKTDVVHGLDSTRVEAVAESQRASAFRISIRKYIED